MIYAHELVKDTHIRMKLRTHGQTTVTSLDTGVAKTRGLFIELWVIVVVVVVVVLTTELWQDRAELHQEMEEVRYELVVGGRCVSGSLRTHRETQNSSGGEGRRPNSKF